MQVPFDAAPNLVAGGHDPGTRQGRLLGAMMAMAREQPLPADTEARLADFTELVATALANAENQAQLTASRARSHWDCICERRRRRCHPKRSSWRRGSTDWPTK